MADLKGKALHIWKTRKVLVILVAAVLLIFIAIGVFSSKKSASAEQQSALNSDAEAKLAEMFVEDEETVETKEGVDAILLSSQDRLTERFGVAPEGNIWELDGSLLSLGDPSMSSEEALYSYIRGVSTLDFSAAHKFSRNSTVVESYDSYFNSNINIVDYKEKFLADMYKAVLVSLQPGEIVNSATFANDKMTYTVKLRGIDLSDKDFWVADKEEIFNTLYLYDKTEEDKTKATQYLYDYIVQYYNSDDAKLRDVDVDFTVQRFPDIDSGWLVSIDRDLDALARYTDGTVVADYIQRQFQEWKLEKDTQV